MPGLLQCVFLHWMTAFLHFNLKTAFLLANQNREFFLVYY